MSNAPAAADENSSTATADKSVFLGKLVSDLFVENFPHRKRDDARPVLRQKGANLNELPSILQVTPDELALSENWGLCGSPHPSGSSCCRRWC